MTRAALRAMAATMLVAVLGIAIRRHPFRWHTTSQGSLVHADTIATWIAVALTAVGAVVLIASLATRGGPRRAMPVRRWWNDLIVLGILLAVIAVGPRLHLSSCSPAPPPSGRVASKSPPRDTAVPVHRGHPTGTALLLVLLLTVAGGALLLTARRRSSVLPSAPGLSEGDASQAAGVRTTVDDGLDAAALDPDPRRAIVAAFAGMETSLAGHGLPRRRSETAVEFVHRVLLDAAAPRAAVSGLCGLFEEARYSTHRLGQSHRAEAIGYLTAIREALG